VTAEGKQVYIHPNRTLSLFIKKAVLMYGNKEEIRVRVGAVG
jgi:hypothetical protein